MNLAVEQSSSSPIQLTPEIVADVNRQLLGIQNGELKFVMRDGNLFTVHVTHSIRYKKARSKRAGTTDVQ
jgi:hypothetical protein